MSGTSRLEDVLMLAVERRFSFTDFEPRGIPGFESDIAKVFGQSEHQTKNLLEAVDTLADDHHYCVERVEVREAKPGNKGKSYPRRFQVTVSPA